MATPIHQFEGKYEILEKIAEGGMGALYKVRHRLLDEVRVIKVMRPQLEKQEGIKARFLREARLASKMRQANIAQLYDFSMDESANAFIVMEYIDGITLQQMLQRAGPCSTALTLEMAKQSLLALDYLHRKKVVHRDISPDNFMITADEMGDPLIKLIDLGIAKALQADAGLTATGMFVGKIRYASPEHFKPDEGTQVDQRSDLYSFGVVLYELLTGTHPIEGSNFSTLIAGHLFRPPVDFKVSDPDNRVPEELREIVLRALAKAPSDRYPNARAFRDDISEMQRLFPVDEACLDEVGRLRQLAQTGRPVSKPGSTQERINAEFQGATPAPSAEVSDVQMTEAMSPSQAEGGVVPFAPSDTEQEKRVEALLSAAERLIHADLLAEARVQLQAVLRIDEGNERVRALLERVEEKERHAEAIARAVADVEARLDSGQPDQAADVLEHAVAELGETEALLELRRKVAEAQEAERAERAAALATEAQALLGDERFEEAVQRLQEAVRLSPEQSDLQAQLATATAALRRHEGDQRRAEALARAEEEVAGHLEQGRLDEARDTVEKAAARLGDAEEIEALRERIAAAEEERRQERVAALLLEAAELQQADDPRGAASRLEEALDIDPDCAQARTQLEQVRETIDRTARRESELEDELARIDGLLGDERFDEARSALESAREDFGEDPRLDQLQSRLGSRERAWSEARRTSLVRSAQGLLADGRYEEAIESLEEAVRLDPEDASLKAQLDDSRRALERDRQRKRVAEAVREVELQLDEGRAAEAGASLQSLAELDGADLDEVERLRARLEELEAPAADATQMMPVAGDEADASDATRRFPVMDEKEEGPEETPETEDDDHPTTRLEAIRPTPPPDEAPSPDATVVQEVPAPSVDETRVTPTPVHDSAARTGGPVPAPTPAAAEPTAKPSSRVSTASVRERKLPSLPSPRVLAAVAGAILVVVVLVVVVRGLRGPSGGGGAAATGTLVIAAAPWAEVVQVVGEAGEPMELPDQATTPMTLDLPPGRYTVTLRHPDRAEPWTQEVEVEGGETRRTLSDAVPMTVDDFLAKYGL